MVEAAEEQKGMEPGPFPRGMEADLITCRRTVSLIHTSSWVSPKPKSTPSPSYQADENKRRGSQYSGKDLERRLEGVLSSVAGSVRFR